MRYRTYRAPDDCEIAIAADLCSEVIRLRGRIAQLDDEFLEAQRKLKNHGIIIDFKFEFGMRKIPTPPRTPLDET